MVVDGKGAAPDAVPRIAEHLGGLPNVAALLPPQTDPASGTTLLTVLPKTGPDSAATEDLVSAIRGERGELQDATGHALR
ncbi:hypothetical protein ACU686_02930 [Yinghuangia aomiensis]